MINRNRWKQEVQKRLVPDDDGISRLPDNMVGKGWKIVVCDLIDRLDATGVPYKITIMREKFAVLSVHLRAAHPHPDAFKEAIKASCNASSVTCEDCGAAGEMRGAGWRRTLCLPCDGKFSKRRLKRFRSLRKALCGRKGLLEA